MEFELLPISEITVNHDSKRIPLNSQQRSLKEKNPLYPYIGANNIMGYIDEFIFDEKILCIAEDGGSWGRNEKCAVIYNEKCWVNNHAHVLTAKDDLILEYLCYYLNYEDLTLFITGATRGKLTQRFLNNLLIPLPPLKTQEKIVEILDAAAALRDHTKKLLEEYDLLAQSIFLDMFGDPVLNPKGWEELNLGKICGVGSSKRVFVKDLIDEGIPFYRGTEVGKLGENKEIKPTLFISKEHYNELKAHGGVPEIGDLLMPSICPDGRIFKVSDNNPFYFKDGRVLWIKGNKNKVNSEYLRVFLKALFNANYSNIASGSTFAELKIFALKKINFLSPPITFQNQFAEKIEIIEQQKELAKQELQESEDLFQALLQRAFKGELV